MKSQVCESGKTFLKKGTWSPEEDEKLIAYIKRYRIWSWTEMAKAAGLMRSGKSCRLRWMNYLRPGIKHGNFSQEEDQIIIELHEQLGNRWSTIAEKMPGRTDNDIKNYWNTRLKKRLQNNLVPTSSQETQTAATEDNLQRSPISEVDSLLPNSPKSSNSVGYKASPMSSTQSFTYELSSSSPDPSGEIYVNQTTKTIGLSAKYGKLQSSLQKPFPIEGLDVVESYGAMADPGFMVPFFHGIFENEELLSSLEQPLLFNGLDTVGNYAATTDSGFRVPTIHGSFVDEELQSSLEQLLPMTCLDMVEGYAATTDHEFQIPTFHGGFADEELRSLLGQPFPIKRLDTVDGYGSINLEFMASTSKMDLTDEELRSLLEEPFPMAGLDMVEDFGTRGLGSGVSTSQRAFSDEKFITYG